MSTGAPAKPEPARPTLEPAPPAATNDGWRKSSSRVSLPEVHGSVPIPLTGGFWRKLFARGWRWVIQ